MKSNYFLLALEKEKEEINILKKDSLENIDKYTIEKNKESLILESIDNGYINSINQDIFIVKRTGNKINYLETIYNDSTYKEDLINTINGNTKSKLFILNEFIKKMKYNNTYYRYINYGLTNIYKKFYDYFRHKELDINLLMQQKYRDGKWAIDSYPLIRSIIESINIYNKFDDYNTIERIKTYKDFNNNQRNKLLEKINMVTNKDYIIGQIDFFEKIK